MLPCLAQVAPQTKVRKIHSVSLVGLERTNPRFLSRFIKTQKGDTFDQTKIEADIQRLKNLRVFYNVDHEIQEAAGQIKLTIKFKEKFTLLPTLKGGFIDGIFWIQPAIVDYHFLGNKSIIGGSYRYYQRHSADAFYKNHLLFSEKWGLSGDAAYSATIEPTDTFEFGSVSLYNVDVAKINLAVNYNFSLRQLLQFTTGYLNELYVKIDPTHVGPDRVRQNKLLLKLEHFFDYIDYEGNLQKGISNSVSIEGVYTPPYPFNFFKLYNEYKHFFRFLKYDTLAFRVRFGIATNITSPYPPFVIDSFLNIRGSGNRVSRGYLENTINLEYRYLFLLNQWLSIQLITFSDYALLLSLGNQINLFHFAGGGIRIILNKVYNAILAFDYAVNLQDSNDHGFLLKIGQYF